MIKIICSKPEKELLLRALAHSDYCVFSGGCDVDTMMVCSVCIEQKIDWIDSTIDFPNEVKRNED